MQHTPSRFLQKVAQPDAAPASAGPRELQHAHPVFTRFMQKHPGISRFLAEHPKTSRFLLNVAHHIPVIERYVPLAPHISSSFAHRSQPQHNAPKPPRFG